MNTKKLLISLAIIISGLTFPVSPCAIAWEGNLLFQYHTGDEEFKRIEIGDMIVYFHQRMIDQATIEKDYIVYQFDQDTEELLSKKIHWRSDLPEHVTPKISKWEAESMVKGELQFSKLYIISPESDVFPLEPTPQNPCWTVRSVDDGKLTVTIIDAVDGKILGYGVPPPYTGFSLSGPWYFNPDCWGAWTTFYQNAEDWFNTMGYHTEAVKWPEDTEIRSHMQSCSTTVFYEIAHGTYTYFGNSCTDITYASEIHSWIADYTKMPFAFIGSCDGMCEVGPYTFSYEFRKGSMENTVTVGYCHLSEPQCDDAWIYALNWQDAMFGYMNQEYTVKAAFDHSLADYPMCTGCMIFCGDEDFAVVPVVARCEPQFTRGDANGDGLIDIADVVYLVNYLYKGGSAPEPMEAGDCNCDEIVDIGDVVYLINYLYKNGTEPGC